MKSFHRLIAIFLFAAIISSCKKDSSGPANTVTIKNLVYTPTTVNIIPQAPIFMINGSVEFSNAQNGIGFIKLRTSLGNEETVTVNPNNQTQGVLEGYFQFLMPKEHATISFEIWVIDNGGNASNRLTGNIDIIINDNATAWASVSNSYNLRKVLYTNETYYAVGQNGTLIKSINSANWITLSSGTSAQLNSICKSNNAMIVVGENNTILQSADGMNWSKQSIDNTQISLRGVASNGSSFVAVGRNFQDNTTVILNSTDGTTWTQNSFSVTSGELYNIVWSGSYYVAVGQYPSTVLVSADGVNWQNKSSQIPSGGNPLYDIVWSGTKFVAVGYGRTVISTDGINWNEYTNSGVGISGITWSGKRFAGVGANGIYTSTDGISWNKTADCIYPLWSITWTGCHYIAVGFISPVIMVSP